MTSGGTSSGPLEEGGRSVRDIMDSEQRRILKRAVEQSRRYRLAMGKECPECERPGFYIAEQGQCGKPSACVSSR